MLDKREIKQQIFILFWKFYQMLFKKQIKDTVDLGEGTSPKLALGLGSEKQDLSPYLIRLRSFRPKSGR